MANFSVHHCWNSTRVFGISNWPLLTQAPWADFMTVSQLSVKQWMQIESVRGQRTVYIENDCLRGTDSDESPT